ncbi:DUF4190 domain-containing protein [Cellulomonas sp.]|uniref:DUF4190 domain-containing protein n=1 Tax=Cellulomonas sp. TaxID=40001 RepID=UPI0025888184|nr:DUF4190 domain-containing protein [Cellulomonas sp.]MCR6688339.1 DUF4190 domain-containing protein [Cellulomonas sp.]
MSNASGNDNPYLPREGRGDLPAAPSPSGYEAQPSYGTPPTTGPSLQKQTDAPAPSPYGAQQPYPQQPYPQQPYAQQPYPQTPYGAPAPPAGYGPPQYGTPYPAQHPYPPQGYPGYAASPPNDGMAIASFVVSLVGLIATSGLLSPLGLILGIVAQRRIRRSGAGGRGFALAAVVIGAIGTLLLAVFAAFIIWAVTNDSSTWTYESSWDAAG